MTLCALSHTRGRILPSRVTHTGNLLLLRARLEVPMGKSRAASSTHTPAQNDLLAALPAADYERLLPDLELVPLPLGMVVYESGGKLDYVHFPTDCIVSLLYVMKDGASAEIAVVGHEGLVGVALFMGGESTPSRAVVQSAGSAYRLSSKVLKKEFEQSHPLQHLLLRYTQALITRSEEHTSELQSHL